MDKVFSISFILLVVSGVAIVVTRLEIERLLENNHTGLWNSLGSPKLFHAPSKIEENTAFMRYFGKKRHLELGDENLNRLASKANLASKIGVFLTVVTAISGFIAWSS